MGSNVRNVEADVHLKASAEQFHDIFCGKTHHIPNISPKIIQGAEIFEGERGTEGSIILWKFVHDGKAYVSKEQVQQLDKENYKITYKVLEGDLLQQYKSFSTILQVTPQEKGSVAHWIIEYEKQNDHAPDVDKWMQFTIELTKEIDAHLTHDQQ